MNDVEKIINALKDEYFYCQDIAYTAQKEGDEEQPELKSLLKQSKK